MPSDDPLISVKKTRRRGPGKKQKLELDLSKTLKETFLQSKALEGALSRAPDLFILGGGFYLGYVMNMRPGIDVPLIPGGFVGFPDFGSKVKDLQSLVKAKEAALESFTTTNEKCMARCQAGLDSGLLSGADYQRCIRGCQQENGREEELAKELGALRQELLKHKVAQGVLMSTLIYAFTRPGFLQGIGEIIPG